MTLNMVVAEAPLLVAYILFACFLILFATIMIDMLSAYQWRWRTVAQIWNFISGVTLCDANPVQQRHILDGRSVQKLFTAESCGLYKSTKIINRPVITWEEILSYESQILNIHKYLNCCETSFSTFMKWCCGSGYGLLIANSANCGGWSRYKEGTGV